MLTSTADNVVGLDNVMTFRVIPRRWTLPLSWLSGRFLVLRGGVGWSSLCRLPCPSRLYRCRCRSLQAVSLIQRMVNSHSQPWPLPSFPVRHPAFSSSWLLPLLYQLCWRRCRAHLISSQYPSSQRSCWHRPDVTAAAGLPAQLRPAPASASSQAAPLGWPSRQ